MSPSNTQRAFFCFVIVCSLIGLHGRARGQSCSADQITIESTSSVDPPFCEMAELRIKCKASSPIQLLRGRDVIFDSSSSSAGNDSMATVYTLGNCSYLFYMLSAGPESTGNYTCRTETAESIDLAIVVEPMIQLDCSIESSAIGYVVQAGDNATCSSVTGVPSWEVSEAGNTSIVSVIDIGSGSSTTMTFGPVSEPEQTAPVCNVQAPPTSACAGSTSCLERFLITPAPPETYLTLTPDVAEVREGHSQTFTCTTSLPGTVVSFSTLVSLPESEYSTSGSDTARSFLFRNVTINVTVPIIECSLQFQNRVAARKEAFIALLPQTSGEVATTSLTTAQISSTTDTTMHTNASDIPASSMKTFEPISGQASDGTTNGMATTAMKTVVKPFQLDFRFIIVGLVVGLLLFLAIVALIALFMRQKARKKGAWTVGSLNRRRGRGEIAMDEGVQGRLEWDTDRNPLVVFETSAMSFVTTGEDVVADDDDNGSLTTEDLAAANMPNGHTVDRSSTNVVAIIENHVDHDGPDILIPLTERAGIKKPEDLEGIHNESYTSDDDSVIIHQNNDDAFINQPHANHVTSTTKEHPLHDSSSIPDVIDAGSIGDDDAEPKEVDLDILHFVDATSLDRNDSIMDGDSGLSLGRQSLLSEIDDDGINIVTF